jgi:hypothetical protein
METFLKHRDILLSEAFNKIFLKRKEFKIVKDENTGAPFLEINMNNINLLSDNSRN